MAQASYQDRVAQARRLLAMGMGGSAVVTSTGLEADVVDRLWQDLVFDLQVKRSGTGCRPRLASTGAAPDIAEKIAAHAARLQRAKPLSPEQERAMIESFGRVTRCPPGQAET
jgi:hypothetical protein